MGTGELNAGGNPAMDWNLIQGGVGMLSVASCYRNQDKLRPDGPIISNADFTFTLPYHGNSKLFQTKRKRGNTAKKIPCLYITNQLPT